MTLRVVYIAMYVAGLPTIRSAVWTLALLVNIAILFIRLPLKSARAIVRASHLRENPHGMFPMRRCSTA